MKTVNFKAFSRPTLIEAKSVFMAKKIKDTIYQLIQSGEITPEEAIGLYQDSIENIEEFVKMEEQVA